MCVTYRCVSGAGILGGIFEGLASAGLTYILYTGVEANPSIRCVEESVALYKQEGCDCLLGIGGGSSMDTAKACGAVMANP